MRRAKQTSPDMLDDLWAHDHAEWRDPAQIIGQSHQVEKETARMQGQVQGPWWETLADLNITLVIGREYEHFVLAMTVKNNDPHITYLSLPHPSGIAFDATRQSLYIAATRNPNQIIEFKPVTAMMQRTDIRYEGELYGQLMPVQTRYYPGSFYIHDIAVINGALHANSVGQNAILRFEEDGRSEVVWWPQSIEGRAQAKFDKNFLQLNSIAAGADIESSYFSASTESPSNRRPGHQNFPVDGCGVIFEGKTRDVIARGLTRPHSARLHQGKLYVDNSGYGTFGLIENGKYEVITRLPGWTRGLAFFGDIAFVGTSRVIPRFSHYAPGLDIEKSVCGIHAVDIHTGSVLASMIWTYGNQIFAVECLPRHFSMGFPFNANLKRYRHQERQLFYGFQTERER